VYMTPTKATGGTLDLPLPTFIPRRYRPDVSAWSAHLPFAADLISATRPSLIVELGTHYGDSYFGFCQSVAENGLACLCYAVDHWLGEEHSGFYGEEVFEDVRRHNDDYYKSFSYLLRTSFDDAVHQFTEETIDLLHLDGLHTYEAVCHDFRTWLPKVKPGGIVLLHDIAVRHDDFGVWRLWDELAEEFAETFAFHHSWGLGVLRKAADGAVRPVLLDLLFDSSPILQERIRRHYVLYASHLENTIRPAPQIPDIVARTADESTVSRVQVFIPLPTGYSEVATMIQTLEFGQWSRMIFNLPTGTGGGSLRIDPADCPCVIELDHISIIEEESGNVLWSAEDTAALRSLTYSGSAALLPREDKCLLFSYGDDPQLQLPPVSDESKQVSVTISLRLNRTLETVVEVLNDQSRPNRESEQQAFPASSMPHSHAELLNLVGAQQSEIVDLRANLNNAQADRQRIEAELSRATAELDNVRGELRTQEQLAEAARLQAQSESVQRISAQTALQRIEAELSGATTEMDNARREIRMLEELAESARLRAQRESAQRISAQNVLQERVSARNALEAELTTLQASLTSERTARIAMERSRSWLVTKPLRKFRSLLRKQL
jgi:hypothetical protein